MRRTSGGARDVRRLLILCSVVTAFGCHPELAPPRAGTQMPPGVPTKADDYQRFVANDVMSPNIHHRKRTGKCFLCSVVVNIQAVGNTLDINPDTAPVAPVRVAHLVNTDKKNVEKFFGLLPSDAAEYDLWVWKKPGRTLHAQWSLLKVSKVDNSVTAADPRDLNYCHLRQKGDDKSSNADFASYAHKAHGWRECDYEISEVASKVDRASLFSAPLFGSLIAHMAGVLVQYSEFYDGWIDCNNGCCT